MSDELKILEHVPLAPLSTLGVGGPARFYLRAENREAIEAGVGWAKGRGVPVFVLGGGSNIVVSDEGFPGLVLHVALRGVTILRDGVAEIEAAAGEEWDPLVAAAVERGWAGLECLSGIPGLVGATPIQNVGAYGQDVSETLTRVDAFEVATGRTLSFSNEKCRFGYRESRFKREDRGRYVILGATFRLLPGGAPAVRYPELERNLAAPSLKAPTLEDVRAAVIEIRRGKSMVIDSGDPNRRSVGSFFVNPVVPAEKASEIREIVRREGGDAEAMPAFPARDSGVKLSAAWLIERSGLARGDRRGNVGISTNHTLAVVNRGGGTAREVVALAREIRQRVLDRFGVTLVPEPVFVNLEF